MGNNGIIFSLGFVKMKYDEDEQNKFLENKISRLQATIEMRAMV